MATRPYQRLHLEPAGLEAETDWSCIDPLIQLVVERVRRRRLEASTSTTTPAPVAPAGPTEPATT